MGLKIGGSGGSQAMTLSTTQKSGMRAGTPAAGSWQERRRGPWVICLLLALGVIAVYWRVARHDFVNYDDGDYVTANAHVQGGLNWTNVAWAFTTGHASNWHPLTWLSHMLDCQWFGEKAGAHHLVSVGWHLANTVLLFLVLRRMTRANWRSALVAAIFALHPLHVESVAWVSERKDVLSTFFLLLTLGAYTAYLEAQEARRRALPGTGHPPTAPARRGPPAKGRGDNPAQGDPGVTLSPLFQRPAVGYVLSLLFFALGLMSKPMLVTVPFLLLLLDYWPFGRGVVASREGAPESRVGGPSVSWIRLALEKTPFFALAVISSVVTFMVQRRGGAVSTSLAMDQRLGNAVVSYVRYLYKTFCPVELAVLYPHPGSWPLWQVIGALLLLLAIFALVLGLGMGRPYLVVGWLWFLGTLVPVIGIVQVGIQSMADRYTYVPLIGLSIAVVWLVAEFCPPGTSRRQGFAAGAALMLFVCGLLTARQIDFWRDSESLFRRAVEVSPRNYLAYNNLGHYLSNRGRPLEAMENYRKSIEINPAYEDALNNMGFVLAGLKRHAEAVPFYEAALRVRPRHVEVHNNLGNALSDLGKIDEAIDHYRVALRENPDHADTHNNLGIALAMQGKLDEAILHFRDAMRLKVNYASAHSNLGNALAAQQKWEEAIAQYQEGLRLNPADPQAHNNLANVLAQQGKLTEALDHYHSALRLNANNPEAHFNLGMALLRLNDRPGARTNFLRALNLKPDYTEAQRQLKLLDQ